jgi:hypothetical protein
VALPACGHGRSLVLGLALSTASGGRGGRPAILKGLNPPAQGGAAGALPWVPAGKPSNPVGVASPPGRMEGAATPAELEKRWRR